MANWDFRRVVSWEVSSVSLEDGEVMKVYVVPDGSPGGFRFQLRGKDYPVWLKDQRAAEEAKKKAAEAAEASLLESMLDGSNSPKS